MSKENYICKFCSFGADAGIALLVLFIVFVNFSPAYSEQTPKEIGNKKNPIHVKSEKMVSDNSRNMITFIKNVVVNKGDITIYADKMDIFTDKEQKKLKSIIALGNVKIIRKEMVATCQKAIYEVNEEKLILTGDPVVTENDNVIEGSKIIYLIKEENIIVQGDDSKKVEVIFFSDDIEEKYDKEPGNK